MAELTELENRLSALRRQLAEMSRGGCTPTQFLWLQRELIRAWADIKDYRAGHVPGRPWSADDGSAPDTRDGATQNGRGRSRR
jgi:hypothetical protein